MANILISLSFHYIVSLTCVSLCVCFLDFDVVFLVSEHFKTQLNFVSILQIQYNPILQHNIIFWWWLEHSCIPVYSFSVVQFNLCPRKNDFSCIMRCVSYVKQGCGTCFWMCPLFDLSMICWICWKKSGVMKGCSYFLYFLKFSLDSILFRFHIQVANERNNTWF